MITPERLKAFAPKADPGLAAALEAARLEYGITTAAQVAHLLGQLHHESGGLTRLEEGLSYSAVRLTEVWPARFPSLAAAELFARNPEALANKVYGGRLGNTQPGDGWRFRGRGLIQTTGRDNYTRAAKATGLDLVADPDLLKTPIGAARAACAYWRDHDLNTLANSGDLTAITKAINGGLVGLAERKVQVAWAREIWS